MLIFIIEMKMIKNSFVINIMIKKSKNYITIQIIIMNIIINNIKKYTLSNYPFFELHGIFMSRNKNSEIFE